MVNVYLSWTSGPSSKEEVAYVSPENPRFQTLTPEENEERMAQLYDDLQQIGIPNDHIRVTQFFDTRTGYTEHSFYVEGIELEDALLLADRYGQAEILTDEGIVDVETQELRVPTKRKITGDEALQQPAYSTIEGIGPVTYEFDTPEVRGEQEGQSGKLTALQQEFMQLIDEVGDDIINSAEAKNWSSIERDQLVTLTTQAKEAVLADPEKAGQIVHQMGVLIEQKQAGSL